MTVFYKATRKGHPEILKVLISHWPEGISLKNRDGDTPLVLLIFNNARGYPQVEQAVRILVSEGGADATGQDAEIGHSPLYTAVRSGNIPICQILITEGGADAHCVVHVNNKRGEPYLSKDVSTWEDMQERTEMLKALRSLLLLVFAPDIGYELGNWGQAGFL